MSISTVIIAVLLPVGCIAVATALMRLFDVKPVSAEQAQQEAERLLAQVNRDLTVRCRVRAGVPVNAALSDFQRLTTLKAARMSARSV